MASKNYNNNAANPPKYLNDFSKALAGEVRILLAEVGKLRDERRQLQYEIAELMSVKSKHGAGGEYSPEWRPAIEAPPPADAPPPPPPPEEALSARPGWRVVHKRPERRLKAPAKITGPPPPPPPALPEPPRPDIPAWAQWRPNPLLAPTPVAPVAPSISNSPPPRSGLFGPATPPPK